MANIKDKLRGKLIYIAIRRVYLFIRSCPKMLAKASDKYVYINWLKFESQFRYIVGKPTAKFDLVIIDDFLPNNFSPFRANEFAFLLSHVEHSALFSIIATRLRLEYEYAYGHVKNEIEFENYKKDYIEKFQLTNHQIFPFYNHIKINTGLAYIVFLSNAHYLIDYLEKRKIKFILELYPGGGFQMTEGEPLKKLARVLGSPCLASVIVTMKNTHQYVLEKKLCPLSKIEYKYGGILPAHFFNLPDKAIKYGANKKTIDICFTAAKYMPKGLDKGYDIFIDMAHLLLQKSAIFHFHVVGNYDKGDIEIEPRFLSNVHFYGFLKTDEFIGFYSDKDIFVSPSRPYVLGKGAFDGFPTTACAEAGLNGLCMVVSDPLDLNVIFEDKIDVIIVENDPAQFANAILGLSKKPDEIYSMGIKGKEKLKTINPEDQLDFRLSVINKHLKND